MKGKSIPHSPAPHSAEGKVFQNMTEMISTGMVVSLDILTWFLVWKKSINFKANNRTQNIFEKQPLSISSVEFRNKKKFKL